MRQFTNEVSCGMPTVLLENGFRFFFYSNENEEPMHIHVKRGNAIGKIWLEPEIRIAYTDGFSLKEERQIMEIISNKVVILQQKWNDYFSQ